MSEDEREEFEERAAILEFDAGMCREWAERIALRMVIEQRARRAAGGCGPDSHREMEVCS
jgi:hypothetical protein